MIRRGGAVVLVLGLALMAILSPGPLVASDHDDGEMELKGRHLNLTDLYVFRQGDQEPGAPVSQLIFIMNLNPRSVARQQYYFSTNSNYEFKVSRVSNNNNQATGVPNVTLRLTFGAPDSNRRQPITLTAIRDGVTTVVGGGLTTPLGANPIINRMNVGGDTLSVFAGLRQDPFFFDVEQYFRVRAGALGFGPAVGFRDPGVDFTWGYNVLSIAVRVSRQYLRGATSVNTFDVWEKIITTDAAGNPVQTDRLARPAINEGLIITNDFLNALNGVQPDFEAACLAGTLPPPQQAACNAILAEAAATLAAYGNSQARIGQIVAAFLPDVMRIDTTIVSGYTSGFAGLIGPATLKGGRKILDDVIDATLFVLTNGAITTDNVAYTSSQGTSTPHSPLLPGFPYLPAPH